jgi:hypothetical protein
MKKYLLIAILVLAIAAGVFIQNSGFKTHTPESPQSASRDIAIYKNDYLGFTFNHPRVLTVHEVNEGGGAFTFSFESPKEEKGFQIFIAPYTELKISEDRFKRDVPSGVRKNSVSGMVGGVQAVFFESQNAVLGDTREVWFIKNGYLYEVTTPKALETWLYPILETWRFTK